jgi:DNA-binding protein HU-beta
MRMAIAEAQRGDFPFGAVIVRDGRVLARGRNLGRTNNDPTAHGEMTAIRRCLAAHGSKALKGVIESLAEIGYKELKKTGAFFVPGFAKFVVIKKPATKERQGINPFTKEPAIFKAKPARKIIRARPVKAAKDAVS